MQIEYEATFPNINKNEIREKLRNVGATLIRSEFLQKRVAFNFPIGHERQNGWLRVRDEVDKITMSIKIISGEKIEDQKEICLKVDSFDEAVEMLEVIGCQKKAYQETKREIWRFDDVDIMIDEWPCLEPFVEVEGTSEESVRMMSEMIGFDYADAMFCGVTSLYMIKYGVSQDLVDNQTPIITFETHNPFV